ncbi:MAG: hypothetical protein KC657_20800 [Myxococcales bacterium]|nr:hypothetical protein [Myxococcales bacterium]
MRLARALWLGALVACGGSATSPAGPSDGGVPAEVDASADAAAPGEGGAVPACPTFGAPAARGVVGAPEITEASGLVASRRHADVVWTHNDSGDVARVFALRTTDASVLGAVSVTGANATDWEDIALGTHAGVPSLFIGDIGDNAARRPNVTVYIAPEPDVAPLPASVAVTLAMTLTYEDGPRDAEALVVDPRSGELVVIEKSLGPAGVYVLTPPFAATGVLRRVATIDLSRSGVGTLVTAADVTGAGDAVIVRTYGGALWYPRAEGSEMWRALVGTSCPIDVASEGQGESIAASADAKTVFTLSEGVGSRLNATPRL